MRVIVIGANGQLGWELCRKGKEQGFDILAFDLPEIDIADASSVEKVISQVTCSLVINSAAYTAVDQAEKEPERAYAINQDGPAHLASYCAKARIPLIHISTDYVFDGNKKGPYLETDAVFPLGVYGKSKVSGEIKVRKCLQEHIILRTAWLYGTRGQNFVKTMLRLGTEREELRVVADQYGCPTYAADLAEAIMTIVNHLRERHRIAWGTYHYCGRGKTSWHGFAEEIFHLARSHCFLRVKRVVPITTEEYPTLARRPNNSVLDCSLITRIFGIKPKPWRYALVRMLSEMFTMHE